MSSAYSRCHRILEVSALGLFGVFAGELAWELAWTLDGVASWLVLAASILTGYVMADLVSGIVRRLADRYGSKTTPLLGASFIRPFREHHLDPKAITLHDFIETDGSNGIVSTPFMAATFFLLPMTPSLITTFALGAMLVFCLTSFATNQFHKWAHMDKPPRGALLLREWSPILTPENHYVHYAASFDRNYCITVCWWNPLLERLRLFERVEATLILITDAPPAEGRRLQLLGASQDIFHQASAIRPDQNVINRLT